MNLAIVAVLVILVGIGSVAAYRPTVVSANEFVLRDEQGRPRGRLGFSGALRGPQLALYDAKGELRIRLVQARNGAGWLEVRDEKGRERASLGYDPGDRPWLSTAWLAVHNPWRDGIPGGVYMCVGEQYWGGCIETRDNDGAITWSAPLFAE